MLLCVAIVAALRQRLEHLLASIHFPHLRYSRNHSSRISLVFNDICDGWRELRGRASRQCVSGLLSKRKNKEAKARGKSFVLSCF